MAGSLRFLQRRWLISSSLSRYCCDRLQRGRRPLTQGGQVGQETQDSCWEIDETAHEHYHSGAGWSVSTVGPEEGDHRCIGGAEAQGQPRENTGQVARNQARPCLGKW